MPGDAKVIEYLREALAAELAASQQYFLHAWMLEEQGRERLARITKKKSSEHLEHAEKLLRRLSALEGVPNTRALFENELVLESAAVARLNRAIAAAGEAGNDDLRELFSAILSDAEQHVDFLEAQLHLIQELGDEDYLARQRNEEKKCL